ncbi:AAA family ATPase [Roseateles sp. So40a]|uniref:AAA family ATPase n=1 Tax=Roseateles sp. So40a TaxID=3400226 RepID=UPI003A893284
MYLSSIALTNVRSMESLEIDLTSGDGSNRRWTLLLGENGCGKSSVLKAIGLLLAGTEGLATLLENPDSWIRNDAKSCRIDGAITTRKGESQRISLEIHRGDKLHDILARNAQTLAIIDKAAEAVGHDAVVLGYGVSRRPADASTSLLPSDKAPKAGRAGGLASMFTPGFSLVSLQRWAMDLHYQRGTTALKTIRSALDQLLPEMSFTRIDRRLGDLMFATVDGDIPLAQLSDGYQNMAAWCGDLLYRLTQAYPSRKNPLDAAGVLLIDEIDLHLHPVWQRQLMEFLSAMLPNFQFIATTHSALTAQQSGKGELFVIRREGPKQRPTLIPFVGEPRFMMLHQLLMSPMFGLDSMDSLAVEDARKAARTLRSDRKSLSAPTRRALSEQAKLLQEVPDRTAVTPHEREKLALLQDIKAALDGASGAGGKKSSTPKRKPTAAAAAVKTASVAAQTVKAKTQAAKKVAAKTTARKSPSVKAPGRSAAND